MHDARCFLRNSCGERGKIAKWYQSRTRSAVTAELDEPGGPERTMYDDIFVLSRGIRSSLRTMLMAARTSFPFIAYLLSDHGLDNPMISGAHDRAA